MARLYNLALFMKIPDKLILKTQQKWSQIYGHPISEDEARRIVQETANYFGVLRELKEKQKEKLCVSHLSQ